MFLVDKTGCECYYLFGYMFAINWFELVENKEQMDYQQRSVLITGAGSGIGRACAFEFAGRGALIILADMDEPAGRQVESELQQAGFSAFFLPIDVTSEASVSAGFAEIAARFGSISVLVNNV